MKASQYIWQKKGWQSLPYVFYEAPRPLAPLRKTQGRLPGMLKEIAVARSLYDKNERFRTIFNAAA